MKELKIELLFHIYISNELWSLNSNTMLHLFMVGLEIPMVSGKHTLCFCIASGFVETGDRWGLFFFYFISDPFHPFILWSWIFKLLSVFWNLPCYFTFLYFTHAVFSVLNSLFTSTTSSAWKVPIHPLKTCAVILS